MKEYHAPPSEKRERGSDDRRIPSVIACGAQRHQAFEYKALAYEGY